jgi:hypothetical protein
MSQRIPAPQVQQPPGTYTVEQGLNLTAMSHQTELNNLISAADHVTEIFQTGDISYALMGGFSLKLRGSPRNTFDVDVAVGYNMVQLIEILTPQPL